MYMSKTLEKSSVVAALLKYWKLFAAWAIGLKNKYSADPFLRSEVNVVALQIGFAVTLFLVSTIFFDHVYKGVLQTMISSIIKGISSGGAKGNEISSELELVKTTSFRLFSVVFLIVTVGFTYIVAKLTLYPVKGSLNSQKRFISDIAHELRTPLAVIKTNSEVSLMDDDLDPKAREVLNGNIEELDRISEIINNLLSFSKLVRPEKMSFVSVDMGAVVDNAVSKLSGLASKKHIEITVKKVAPHNVWGNYVALEQIAVNLLKNAITYTDHNGHVTIRLGPDYVGNVVLHMEDNGIGISKKDLLHIFEPFYRAESSRSRRSGSTGLGLTIVNELVKMHSGRITIKSSENKGTVAMVILPFDRRKRPRGEKVDLSDLNEISVNYLEDKE